MSRYRRMSVLTVSICCALMASARSALAVAAPAANSGAPAPSTQPAASISPDAKTLLDAVDAAYTGLKSLEVAGTFSQDIRVDGRSRHGNTSFTSSFLAPNFFRHEVNGNIACGSTGQQAYSYNERMRLFRTGDAPAGRTAIDKLPSPISLFLDPSLMLAVADVPSVALAQEATDISRGKETIIDGVSCPALVLKQKSGAVLTLLFDPKTHLLQRALTDAKGQLEAKGNVNVELALMTVDYTTVTPGASLDSAQFAWTPPEGARDAAAAQPPAGQQMDATALEGKDAPDFKLSGLDDKQVSLADVKGSVTILDFWATWCPPCRASLPHLADIYAKMKGDGLKVYAVNVAEDKPTVQGFVEQTKLALPVLLDTDNSVAQKYDANAIPETVLIGKDGKVRKVFIGFSPETEDQIAAAAKAALAE